MPLPTTYVIHPSWSKHHQPTAKGAMTATCTIAARSGKPVFNPVTKDTVQAWDVAYAGVCRVQSFTQRGTPAQVVQAGQSMSGSGYLVAVDANTAGADAIGPGMRVRITSAPNDPQLAGDDLWVVDIILGSERFQRDLICSTNQTDAHTP